MKKKIKKTVMVFGVFDGLHPGHIFFLKNAKKTGNKLIVVVAHDEAIHRLKGKTPRYSLQARMRHVREAGIPDLVVAGDRGDGRYTQLKKHKPDVICLGYDQKALGKDLRERMKGKKIPPAKITRAPSHHPKKFHSSILHK